MMRHPPPFPPIPIGPAPAKGEAMVVKYYNSDPASGYPADVNYRSAFTYDLAVQNPHGPVSDVVRGARVIVREWNGLVYSFRPGDTVEVSTVGGELGIVTPHVPFAAPCEWQPGDPIPGYTPPDTPPVVPTKPGDGSPVPGPPPRLIPDPAVIILNPEPLY